MGGINSSIANALKVDRLSPRPHGSPGFWVSFLLPCAMAIGGWKTSEFSITHLISDWNTSKSPNTYLASGLYSFNTFLNVLLLLFHICMFKTTAVTSGINKLCAVPAAISIFLYTKVLQFDIKRSLCYAVANALIYFEGLPFLLKAFPKTFTFGEANIVIQGFSFFIFHVITRLEVILVKGALSDEQGRLTIILELALLWIIVFCIVPYVNPKLRQVKLVYIWGFTVLCCIYLSVSKVLHLFLFEWMWNFLTKPERVGVMVLWLACSITAVVLVHHQISKRKKSNTILRKYFHVLAMIVFLSGSILDTNLIYFSSSCIFCLFIVLEAFRLLKLPPLYEFLQNGFLVYRDEKDSGVLALTPICLLVGNALPIWLYPLRDDSNEKTLVHLSGVLSVGIGDTFASVGGKLFGKHFWKGSSKTIEGTICCIFSQVLFIQILVSFQLLNISTELLVKVLTGIFITSIVEAKTDQIDNLVLPLTMYILLLI